LSRRTERVSGVLREEISRLVAAELQDPRLRSLVTLSHISVTEDLQHATLSVTVLGGPEDRADAVEALNAAASFLRRELGQRLRLKRTPELRFELDGSIEEGDHVLDLLDNLQVSEVGKDG
jgi:ribosome-binding factor A